MMTLASNGTRDFLLRHSRAKANGVFPSPASHRAQALNASCGDLVEFQLLIERDKIKTSGYRTQSCALCAASASLLSGHCRGWNSQELAHHYTLFRESLQKDLAEAWPEELKDFQCWQHLRANPWRQNCVLISWACLCQAMATPIY